MSGRDIFIGASIGVAISREASTDSDGLLDKADVAMYRAKKLGPGKVVVYEPHMHTEALNHLSLRAELQEAMQEKEFRLQYQPLMRLDRREIVGVEALIRWHSPVRGLVPPIDFIPVTEETGMIVELGQWVLDTSAAQVAAWRRTHPDLTLNVNVSGHQLMHPQFAANVTRALAVAGLPSSAVTLELTESVLMSDPVAAVAALSSLRELALVRTIVELGQILGLRVVAEGIENAAQLEALRRLGCAYGQGFHLSRPADPADLTDLLRSSGPPDVT